MPVRRMITRRGFFLFRLQNELYIRRKDENSNNKKNRILFFSFIIHLYIILLLHITRLRFVRVDSDFITIFYNVSCKRQRPNKKYRRVYAYNNCEWNPLRVCVCM